ncbi:MAG: hypothetical protein JAZ12_02110 [Candidatus Thiodiazotropha taylori]|nr:hypothetical protein [Candidatus Thiodiazotropha taylori]
MKELNTGNSFIRVYEDESMSFNSYTDVGEEDLDEGTTHIEFGIASCDSVILFGITKFEDTDIPDGLTIINEIFIENGEAYYRGNTIVQNGDVDEFETLLKLKSFNKVIPLSEVNLFTNTGRMKRSE